MCEGGPAGSAEAAQAIRAAERAMRAGGVEEAFREAVLLWSFVSGEPAERVYAGTVAALPPEQEARYARLVARRAAGEPLAYVEGRAGFFGLEFAVDRRVLIPRPDSECLVEMALDLLPQTREATVADVGTGSGCLLLAVLRHRPRARGLGVDASRDALDVAQANARALDLAERCTWVEGSWLGAVADRSVDLLLSNPPYVLPGEELGPGVAEYEPQAALFTPAGDPLACYRAIVADASRVLQPGGQMVLEVGAGRAAQVVACVEAAGFRHRETRRDLGGIERAVGFEAA